MTYARASINPTNQWWQGDFGLGGLASTWTAALRDGCRVASDRCVVIDGPTAFA